ncbi:MAG: hypothetical protein HY983_04115 [Candidatus Magasanikbacteria bacterium]|nr:hypothetical protein [Candidatus Magasanikbacteria bacterium]
MVHKIVLKDGQVVKDGGLRVVRGRNSTEGGRLELIISIPITATKGYAGFVVLEWTEDSLLGLAAEPMVADGRFRGRPPTR